MASNRFDEVRDYDFADRALALRQRAGLTQGELAALMGVGVRSIQAGEAAVSYPGADHLQQLVAVHLEHGGVAAGPERGRGRPLGGTPRTHPRRASTCCCSYSRHSAASSCWTTWRRSWSRALRSRAIAMAMWVTGRCCGAWPRA